MKSFLCGAVLLSFAVVCCCSAERCSTPTDEEMKCFTAKATSSSTDIAAHCKGVDFDALQKADILGSHICQFPSCVTALGTDIYTPCNRSDLTSCLTAACSQLNNCAPVTATQMQCMVDAGSKNGDDLARQCSGVDFDLLKEGRINDSKVCDHPQCVSTLEKDLYTPCNRSDLGPCVNQICMNINCSTITPEELKCMTAAASKNGAELQSCAGVDFNKLKNGDLKGSHICDHEDCIQALDKYLYVPCKRGDLTLCIRSGCKTENY